MRTLSHPVKARVVSGGLTLVLLVGASLMPSVSQNKPEAAGAAQRLPHFQLIASTVAKFLQLHHFSRRRIDGEVAREWVRRYMESFDPQHLYFLESDYEQFESRFVPRLARDIQVGRLDAAFDIYAMFERRLNARSEWVKNRLQHPLDLETDGTYRPDRSKVPSWPANMREADELWEARLKYELISELLAGTDSAKAKEQINKRYERLGRIYRESENEDIVQAFLSSLAGIYDPHSTYYSPSTYEDFSIDMKLSLSGIGAVLSSEDGYCTVREIVPGGPAEFDGRLKPNDRIVGVAEADGQFVDVVEMRLRHVVRLIRGPRGTKVRLNVIPADAPDSSVRRVIELVRDEIKLTAKQARAEIFEVPTGKSQGFKKVGVIHLPSFYGEVGGQNGEGGEVQARNCTEDVRKLLERLMAENVEGVILDLRFNGGGLLDEAINLTGLFIDQGPVVQVKNYNGQVEVRSIAPGSKAVYHGPLIVLVGKQSASASEIAAGALQNYGRALVVGDSSTHGKGTVQAVVELARYINVPNAPANAGALKLTIQKFYLPNGDSTQNRGVLSDISLPSLAEFIDEGEKALPHALPWDRIAPSSFKRVPEAITPDLVRKLREGSEARVSQSPAFQFVAADIERARFRFEQGTVSLNKAERLREKELDDARRSKLKEVDQQLQAQDRRVLSLTMADFDPDARMTKASSVSPEEASKIAVKDQEASENDEADAEVSGSLLRFISDLQLRETLNIMSDWLALQSGVQAPLLTTDGSKSS